MSGRLMRSQAGQFAQHDLRDRLGGRTAELGAKLLAVLRRHRNHTADHRVCARKLFSVGAADLYFLFLHHAAQLAGLPLAITRHRAA